jgi:hypothetical protein
MLLLVSVVGAISICTYGFFRLDVKDQNYGAKVLVGCLALALAVTVLFFLQR